MRFNDTPETSGKLSQTAKRAKTTNHEGGEAFDPSEFDPRLKLAKLTINNLLEDTYYQTDTAALVGLRIAFDDVVDTDPEWALKLAAYARDDAYVRDVAQVLLVLAANTAETQPYVRDYAPDIIQRADEPMSLISIQNTIYGDSTLPNCLRKAIQDALNSFDAYQLAKWDRPNRDVRLHDVLNVVHPVAYDDQHAQWFEQIALGELDDHPDVDPLPTPETWEATAPEGGHTRDTWLDVLPKMGLFAITRNLRNLLEAGVKADEIIEHISLEQVEQSKLYPFRFYQAWRAIEPNRTHRTWSVQQNTVQLNDMDRVKIKNRLSDAADVAAGNIPGVLLESDTAVFADISGSMYDPVSKGSTLMLADIATFFAGVFHRAGGTVGAFASDVELGGFHSESPAMAVAESLEETDLGGATNAWKTIAALTARGIETDRVVLLTDEQAWDRTHYEGSVFPVSSRGAGKKHTLREEWDQYTAEVAPDSTLYMVDLASYGDLSMPADYDNVYQISGWTDRILDWVVSAENPDVMLDEISAREPTPMAERKARHAAQWGTDDDADAGQGGDA